MIKGSRGGRRHRHIPPALTMEQVAQLRKQRAAKVPYKLLAREYGVTPHCLSNAVHGRGAYAEPDVVKSMRLTQMHLDEARNARDAAQLRIDRLEYELDQAHTRLAKAGLSGRLWGMTYDLPPYPTGEVVGPCVCGSWPGGECLRCPVIPTAGREA